jgi:hypothetical protein
MRALCSTSDNLKIALAAHAAQRSGSCGIKVVSFASDSKTMTTIVGIFDKARDMDKADWRVRGLKILFTTRPS